MDSIRSEVMLPSKQMKLGFSDLIMSIILDESILSNIFMSATAATNCPS